MIDGDTNECQLLITSRDLFRRGRNIAWICSKLVNARPRKLLRNFFILHLPPKTPAHMKNSIKNSYRVILRRKLESSLEFQRHPSCYLPYYLSRLQTAHFYPHVKHSEHSRPTFLVRRRVRSPFHFPCLIFLTEAHRFEVWESVHDSKMMLRNSW